MQKHKKAAVRRSRNNRRTLARSSEMRAAAFGLACALCHAAQAQNTAAPPPPPDADSSQPSDTLRLPDMVVTGRADSLVGTADSASVGTVGRVQLDRRPTLRPGEVLETVPGVIITQHSGSGKANQFFLRGFNLDHGTDFATSLDGVPINLPTHGHGQGYTDLNFIIPELITGIAYQKGPYYADQGDFSSAGAANLTYATTLPQSLARVEGGSHGYARGVFTSSPKLGPGHLLYGIELFHNDGPWDHPDDFQKVNGVLRYSQGTEEQGFSITGMGYHGDWDSTDQIPKRAVDSGLISRWDTIDPTDAGDSQRYSLLAEWHRVNADTATKIMAYGFYYDLDLFSNFTYFLNDPVNGDQFEQKDRRYVGGAKASHTWFSDLMGRPMENTIGLQVRSDSIKNGLFNSAARVQTSTVREDRVWQTSVGPFVENKVQWFEKFRTTAGVRGDLYHFDVDANNPANSGNETEFITSPKLGLAFGPWAQTELYVNGGLGFHSNDGRGTTTRMDPATGAPLDPVDPLVRSKGAEIGLRSAIIPRLQSTLSFWMLDIDSELLFIGDAGNTEASRPSRRYGIEFANYYSVTDWLTLDADLSLSRARFRDNDPAGDDIPGSIESVVAAGLSLHDLNGFFGELRVRYFGPRALIEDDSIRSGSSTLLNGRVGYEFTPNWTLAFEVFNILDARASDIDYYYPSRLPGEPAGGVDDIHFHPAEPRTFRVILTARF